MTADSLRRGSPPSPEPSTADENRLAAMIRIVAGALLPPMAYLLADAFTEPADHRVGTVALAIVAACAMALGFRAAVASAISAALVLWYAVFVPRNSFELTTTSVGDLLLFGVSVGLVLLLIVRLQGSLRREQSARRALDRFVDEAPMGIAVFDGDLRFRRVNPVLESINHLPEAQHLGRRLGEMGAPVASDLDGIMERVVATGVPVLRHELPATLGSGEERMFQVSYLRLHRPPHDAALAGIVEDVTEQRRAEERIDLVVRCASELAAAATRQEVADSLVDVLDDHPAPHVVVALRDGDRLEINALRGLEESDRQRWLGSTLDLAMPSALSESCRLDVDVLRGIDGVAHVDGAGSVAGAPGALLEQDSTLIVHPVRSGTGGAPGGVIAFGWPMLTALDPRDVETTRTLATLFCSAVARIDGAEQLANDIFRTALDAMLDDVAIGEAVRNSGGEIVDFVITYANASSLDGAGRSADDMVGHHTSTLYPAWKATGLHDAFARVVDTGEPLIEDEMVYEDQTDSGVTIRGVWRLQVVPFGDGYLAVTRDVTEPVRLREEARRNAELLQQERVAVDLLQQAALPERLAGPGVDLAADYVPATTESPVGGDWYDAFVTSDGRIGLVVGDVAGHGRASVLKMLQARSLVHALALTGGSPSQVLAEANRLLTALWDAQTFATCVYCVLDPITGRLEVANAGHPPPLIVGPTRAERLEARPGPPLGVVLGADYAASEDRLADDESLLLYSDGLVESRTVAVDAGIDRLLVALAPLVELPVAAMVERVVAGVPEVDRDDDLCLLAVRRSPSTGR